jgi:hypothetical protein
MLVEDILFLHGKFGQSPSECILKVNLDIGIKPLESQDVKKVKVFSKDFKIINCI